MILNNSIDPCKIPSQSMELSVSFHVSVFREAAVKSKVLCETERARERASQPAVAVTRGADSVDSLDEMGRVMVVEEMF